MALTVVNAPYRQERTPFWERVGTDLLLPVLSDLWKEHRQTLKNRKENAMKGEFERLKKEFENMGQDSSGNMGQSNGGFMNAPQMPEGYNSNAWANAFHNTDTPLTQFDMGTADILPPSSQSIQQAQQRKVSTPADLRRIINNLAGMERFSNVSPEAIENLFAPELKAAEEAYKRSLREKYAQDYRNATNGVGQVGSVMPGVINGDLPESIGTMVSNQAIANRPQISTVNTGGQQRIIAVDPNTGEVTERATYDNTLTPQQREDNTYRNNEFAYRKQKDERDFNAGERRFNDTLADTKEARAQQREDANKPRYGAPFAGADGKLYQQDQWGNIRPVMVDGEHMDAPKTPIQWGKQQESEVEYHNNEIKRLEKDIEDLEKEHEGSSDTDTQESLAKRIKNKKLEILTHRNGLKNLYTKPQTQSFKSLGKDMLASDGIPTIVKNGHFGVDRGDHKHAGTDYAMPAGSRIRAINNMGDNMKVVRVNTDPKASTYGCFVELEGIRNGKKVRYIMAHMQKGSIGVIKGENVKGGDYIGRVGNTGHSNGNHLHLEVREWDGDGWRLQNPEQYIRDEPVSRSESTTQAQPNTQENAEQPQEANAQQPQPDTNTTLAGNWTRYDGKVLTQSQVENLIQRAERGELSWASDRQEVYAGLRHQGYSQPAQAQVVQPQTRQNSTQANAGSFWNVINPFAATPAYGEEMPATSQQEQPVNHAGVPYVWYNPSTNSGHTQAQYNDLVHLAEIGHGGGFGRSRNDIDNYLTNQGMQRVGTEQNNQTQTSTQSTLANNTIRPDPDGGLTQYRAEGDNSPVAWRNSSGAPMRTSDGQLFTQQVYEDWARKADAGEYRDMNIHNRADLDKWLENVEMHRDTPAEQRGVNNLNGNSNANLPPESEDTNLPLNWGASVKEEVLSIPAKNNEGIRNRAFKMSNELLGAYDQVSRTGRGLRDIAIPFYSWIEVNAKRYYRLIKNGITEDGLGDFASSVLKGQLANIPYYSFKLAKTYILVNLLAMLISAFNHFVWPKDEEKLPPNIKNKIHITLGHDTKGNVLYFERVGAMLDNLEWFGQEESPFFPFAKDIKEIFNGRQSFTDFAWKLITSPINKVVSGINPIVKTPFEVLTGKSLYPDVTHPRNIRDNGAYFAQSFGLSWPYKNIMDTPVDNWKEFKSLFMYQADADEAAYFYTLGLVRDFQERVLGKRLGGFVTTQRGNVLYNMKTALRLCNKDDVQRYLQEYYRLGGDKKGLKASMRNMNPLHGLNKQEQAQFKAWISEEDRKYLARADAFFHSMADAYLK